MVIRAGFTFVLMSRPDLVFGEADSGTLNASCHLAAGPSNHEFTQGLCQHTSLPILMGDQPYYPRIIRENGDVVDDANKLASMFSEAPNREKARKLGPNIFRR